MNPNALLLIVVCTVAGLLLGSVVWGLFIGLCLVLVATVVG